MTPHPINHAASVRSLRSEARHLRAFPLSACALACCFALHTADTAAQPAPVPASPAALPAAPTLLERAFDFDEGKSRPRDAAAAAALYQQAADAGDAFAHLRLGYLCETGDGVRQDYAAARAHYQIAADAGIPAAHLRLAICNLEGWGAPADRPAFVREITTAAEAGYSPAQNILATMNFIGFGVPKDPAAAMKWLERAASLEDSQALVRLGNAAERAARLARSTDLTLARSWYQLSAEQEYQNGMRAMAATFLTGPAANRNWSLAQQWLNLASDQGDPYAPFVLAIAEMIHPDSPSRDSAKAHAWLELSSTRGNAAATELLELEAGGRPLADAMRYVLTVPFEQRYISRQAAKINDSPTQAPIAIRLVQAVYPNSLRLTHTNGEALVDFIVDTTGRVTGAHVFSATHPLFGERAVEAVSQWRFQPARRDGRTVNTRMRVPIYFNIPEKDVPLRSSTLTRAKTFAQALGPQVMADAVDLALAGAPTGFVPPRVLSDGAPPPLGSEAILLLVLDPTGHPIRGHILNAYPQELGPALLEATLAAEFPPRKINDQPVAANVVFRYFRDANAEQKAK